MGVSTEWDNTFSEWIIFAEDEEDDGKLVMKWPLRQDWSEWEVEFGGIDGELYLRRENDPGLWEGSADNQLITARTVWPGDMSEWIIVQEGIRINLRTRYGNLADEWIVDHPRYGFLRMYTDWEGDPRDWIVEDELSEEIPKLMKLMIIHLVLIQSAPKL